MEHLSNIQITNLIEGANEKHPEWTEHIRSCMQCRSEYEAELAIYKDLKSLEYQRPSMRFAKNIHDLLVKSQKANRASMFWMRFTSYTIIIAIFLSLLMLGFLFSKTVNDFPIEEKWLANIVQWNMLILYALGAFIFFYFLDKWLARKMT